MWLSFMVFPAEAEALAMTRLSDLRAFYRVAPEVWAAVVSTLGDPAEDLRATKLEPKMKMTHVLDQADETEFMVEPEETRAKWVTQYVSLTGGLPPEEEEPSMEQLSALSRRVFSLKGAPYADFSVWVPYGRFRSYVATLEGFVTKELAGPTNFEMWQASFRVYRTAMVMLNITPLAHLNAYETHIEKMVHFYPGCWHLIVQADDRARSEHLTRLKLRVTVGRSLGLDQPKRYSDDNPWQTLFTVLIDDDRWRLFITDHLRKGFIDVLLEGTKEVRKETPPPMNLDVLGEAVMAEAKEQRVRVTVVSVDTHLEGGVGRAALDGDLSKDRPYLDHLKLAKDGCVDLQQAECDMGTILATRSVDLALAVVQSRPHAKVKPAATLENPPPSTCEGHLSAWELEEVKNFGATIQARTALFNACVYEPHLPLGAKHFKPQQFVGTLPGLTFLSGTCACGAARHDPIVGKAKSSASAEYPSLLCQKYASLAVKHFTRIATEEVLERRMNKVKDDIAKMRKLQEAQAEAQGAVAPQIEEPDGTVIVAKVRPDMSKDQRTQPRVWRGSVGKYGMFKPPSKDLKVERLDHIGGMRDPAKAVAKVPSLASLGLRIAGAWEAFVRQFPETMEIAECYGTKGSSPNPKYVEKWKERLNQLAWSEKGGDPETEAQVWLEEGAPLGIEKEIKTCRIFPMSDEGPQEQGLPDAAAQLHRGDMTNYENLEKFPNGTISRLALILKVKENLEVKRRVVIDLRRSRGNAKARLPEKLVLPRPDDAVRMVREIRAAQETSGATRDPGWAMEFIDISDAFMTLPVHEDELGHGLAPSTVEGEYILFLALLFGFKTAPLLWSRVAALIARLLQSAVDAKEGAHQVYLDDSLWCFAGTLRRRNFLLAFVLTTMLALGLKIALGKGERANAVTWVGVRFALVDRDTLVLTLPVKFMEELLALLASWKGRIMAGGRAKWTVAIFYAVMYSVDEGIATGAEGVRRATRADPRSKDGLFPVKRLEQARVWLVEFLNCVVKHPTRLLKVGGPPLAEITIATDASPEGIGAVIFINNVAISALAGPQDARMLRFELG
ncbi:unnamed protein product, partial [Effrenium voratum]